MTWQSRHAKNFWAISNPPSCQTPINTTSVLQARGRTVLPSEGCVHFKMGREKDLTPFPWPPACTVISELTQSSPVIGNVTGPPCSDADACRVWDFTSKSLVWPLQQQRSVIKFGTKPKLLRISQLFRSCAGLISPRCCKEHARCSASATKVQ